MFDVLSLTIPFFGIIALGAFSRAIGFFEDDMGMKLARFAFYFVLPPFFFLAITAAPIEDLFNLNFLIRYEIATFIMLVGAGIASSLLFGFQGNSAWALWPECSLSKYGLYWFSALFNGVWHRGRLAASDDANG